MIIPLIFLLTKLSLHVSLKLVWFKQIKANIGQNEDFGIAETKALNLGARKVRNA